MVEKADFPLFLHSSGQWAKKVKGKTRYFGTVKSEALAKWEKENEFIQAGVDPPRYQQSVTLAELGNVYADFLRRQVASGELGERTASEYRRSIARLVEIVGSDCCVGQLKPIDFGTIKERLAEPIAVAEGSARYGGRTVKRRAMTTVAIDVRNLRVFFNWCFNQEHIEAVPRYGSEFSPVSRKVLQRKRAKDGKKDLDAKTILATIQKSKPAMRAIILLGINAGVGNQDIADMRLSDLPKLAGEVWVDLPRGKTGAPRRFLLWPETVQAIKTYLVCRPKPAGADNRTRLFLTRNGLAWVRQDGELRTDSIGSQFAKARKAAGATRGAFYDLRRTFRTRAAMTRDREAVDHVMGHLPDASDMGAVYNQWIDDDRIRRVCDHVRAWLFADAEGGDV